MRLRSALIIALGISTLGSVIRTDGGAMIWPDARAKVEAERLRDEGSPEYVEQQIAISRSEVIEARFSVTSKGNGTISIPGLMIRVYDYHDDGITFRGGLLRCEWRQRPGQWYLDFVVSGIAERHDEKGQHVIADVPVRAVFRYAPREKRFIPISCSPEIDHWPSSL